MFKLTADHEIDAAFNAEVFEVGNINSIAQQEDGKLLIGGSFVNVNGQSAVNFARLNYDGSLDESFQTPVITYEEKIYQIALTHDGTKILTGGSISEDNGLPGIRSFNIDGSIDTNFDFNSAGGTGQVYKMTVAPTGEIYVSVTGFWGIGIFTPGIGSRQTARLLADGSPDPDFFDGFTTNFLREIIFTLNDKIMISANCYVNDEGPYQVVRLNADWTLDETFDPIEAYNNGDAFGATTSILETEDGRFMIGGKFYAIDSVEVGNSITMLDAEGVIDLTFDAGTGFMDNIDPGFIENIEFLDENRYIITGDITEYKETPISGGLVILDQQGSRNDCDFGLSGGKVNEVSFIGNSSLYAAGNFFIPVSPDQSSIARYTDVCEGNLVNDNEVEINTDWLKIAPNPTLDYINVTFDTNGQSPEYTIAIYDLLGNRLFYKKGQTIGGSSFNQHISIGHFTPGTYILMIETDNRSAVQKILKF